MKPMSFSVLARIQNSISNVRTRDVTIPTPTSPTIGKFDDTFTNQGIIKPNTTPPTNADKLLQHLHNPLTKKLYGANQFNNTYGFWRTLLSAISRGDLTFALISDRPSELADGTLWLSHERVTGLLDEQGFDYADLPPILFNLIMTATNHLYPNAVGKPRYIESEYSVEVCHDTGCRKEVVFAYPIATNALPLMASPTTLPTFHVIQKATYA